MSKHGKYPTHEPDFRLVTEFVEEMGCADPAEGYAVIDGAKYALETYEQAANAGRSVDFNGIVHKTRGVIISEGLDAGPWKNSDDFYLGIALGTFIARRADGRSVTE